MALSFGILVSILFSIAQAEVKLTDLANGQAWTEICLQSKTQHPNQRNTYHLNRPLYHLTDSALFVGQRKLVNDRWHHNVYKLSTDRPDSAELVVTLDQQVRDLVVSDGLLFVLFDSTVAIYDMGSKAELRRFSTGYSINRRQRHHQRARALLVRDDRLLVAHGEYGVIEYTYKNSVVKPRFVYMLEQNDGHQAKITDIADFGQDIVLGIESVTVGPDDHKGFSGLALLNGQTYRTIAESGYDYRQSGAMAHAKIIAADRGVFINNSGFLHYAPLENFFESALNPKWFPIYRQIEGQSRQVELFGDLLWQNGCIYTCGTVVERQPDGLPGYRQFLVREQVR